MEAINNDKIFLQKNFDTIKKFMNRGKYNIEPCNIMIEDSINHEYIYKDKENKQFKINPKIFLRLFQEDKIEKISLETDTINNVEEGRLLDRKIYLTDKSSFITLNVGDEKTGRFLAKLISDIGLMIFLVIGQNKITDYNIKEEVSLKLFNDSEKFKDLFIPEGATFTKVTRDVPVTIKLTIEFDKIEGSIKSIPIVFSLFATETTIEFVDGESVVINRNINVNKPCTLMIKDISAFDSELIAEDEELKNMNLLVFNLQSKYFIEDFTKLISTMVRKYNNNPDFGDITGFDEDGLTSHNIDWRGHFGKK